MRSRDDSNRRGRISRVLIYGLIVCWGSFLGASDQIPAEAVKGVVVLVGGTIHPGEGPVIESGVILIENGRIRELGAEVEIPAGATRVDVSGQHIYPALIACGTQLGLVEIGAVRATRDQREVGEINPNVRAEVSVNPDSELIPVTRANGIGLALTIPQGGLISGSSALLELDGWTWEDLTVRAPVGIHLRWPTMQVEVPGKKEETDKRRTARDEKLARIRAMFEDAQAYRKSRDRRPDLRCEALLPCLEGKIPVFIHAGEIRQIRTALDFAEEMGLRAVLIGGRDAPDLAELLARRNVPVIFGPVHGLPGHRDDDYDRVFVGPKRLHDAGVKFAIAGFSTSNARNLPYHAATAAAYGLPREIALRSITLSAAEILGVGDRVGSLEVGKDATLIVTDADPLEITTQTKMMWIGGRPIDLSSRHTMLYEKYRERIRREAKKR